MGVVNMELKEVGDQVFAAECILKSRVRKVGTHPPTPLLLSTCTQATPAVRAVSLLAAKPLRLWETYTTADLGVHARYDTIRDAVSTCARKPTCVRQLKLPHGNDN